MRDHSVAHALPQRHLNRSTQVRDTQKLGADAQKSKAGADLVYSGVVDGDEVTVSLDFGSRMGQLCYRASPAPASRRISGSSYETLWDIHAGWNYLTEENAQRSLNALPEVISRLVAVKRRLRRPGPAGAAA